MKTRMIMQLMAAAFAIRVMFILCFYAGSVFAEKPGGAFTERPVVFWESGPTRPGETVMLAGGP